MIQGPTCCQGGITGYGSLSSGIAFVGIAPGRMEMREGKPMVGPTGKLLDAVLAACQISRQDVYCTNLICWYKDDPTVEEIEKCSARLQHELEPFRVIVALGALASRALFQLQLSKARGAVLKLPTGQLGMATYHPAAALRSDNKEVQINIAYDIIRDLAKLPRILANEYNFSEPTPIIVSDPESAQKVLDDAQHQGYACLDVETNYDKDADKAHPFSDQLTCIGIGWDDGAAFVLTPSAYATHKLNWPHDVRWVYHNGQFDTQQIARHLGVWLPIGGDTMLQAYSLDERPKTLGSLLKLKVLAREYVGASFYEEDEHKLDGTPESEHALYKYNANDVVYTHRLHQYLTTRQHDEDAAQVYEGILLPAAEMLAHSQMRGIHIDQQAVKHIQSTFGLEYANLVVEIMNDVKHEGFTDRKFLNSPKQIREYIGLQGVGIDSTNKAVLNELLDSDEIVDDFPGVHTFISKLLRYRTLAKLIRGYLLATADQIKFDGRVHPHAFLTGTVTGRLTYRDPAMQTLPKPKTVKDLAVIRRIFAASSPDYILLEADYAQIEAWIAAYLSSDPVLLSDLQSGNWHTNTTEDVFRVTRDSCPDEDTWKFYYDAGKHLNYGFLFEEGPEGMTRRPPIGMGCTISEARAYHTRLNLRYKVFNAWRTALKRQARDDGYITTPFGRKRRFPIVLNDHQQRQMVNAPIQSTASDYTLTSAIKLELPLRDLDAHLLFIEHDALYYEVLKTNLVEAATLIKQRMETPPLPNLPSIRVEMTIGPNLHDMEEYTP